MPLVPTGKINPALVCSHRGSLWGTAMSELLFVVEEDADGGWVGRAVGADIFTQAETLDEMEAAVRDAVRCHYEPGMLPRLIRLHIVQDRLLAA